MMKRLMIIGLVLYLVIGITRVVSAVVFEFDPNGLLDLYPITVGNEDIDGENKATQPNARRVHKTWASTWYETFYNPAAPHTQSDDYNTYMNWRDSLGDGEGISAFNIWLLDNPNARSWGEKTVWDPNGPAPTGTADSAGLWNVQVINNPWGAGWLVQWWTEDSANYLRPSPGGKDVGSFSFTGTAYWDNNENGYDSSDPAVQLGEYARIWFGAVNWTEWDSEKQEWIYDWSLHFDNQGFGSRSPAYAAFAAGLTDTGGYGSGWEGVLSIQAIPEPGTIILLGSLATGLFGMAGIKRRFSRR